MFDALYNFFFNLFLNDETYGPFSVMNENFDTVLFGNSVLVAEYWAYILTLIFGIFIVVLCCLFVYKIIKLIGGLITR